MVGRLGWLKARLIWNGLRADRQRRIGLPLTMGLLGWGALDLARRYREAFAGLAPEAAAEFSVWVAVAFFFVWISLPVVIFPIDETLDPAQFSLAPLSRTQLAAGLAFAGLISPSVVVPVVALTVNTIEWRQVLAVAIVAGALALILLIVSGQLFTTLLSAVLKTRRGRDFSVLIVAFIGLAGFAGQQLVRGAVSDLGLEAAVLTHPVSGHWYLPPVAVQRIVTEAAAGRPLGSVAFVLLTAAWIVVLAWVWQRVLGHMLTTPEEAAGPRRAETGVNGLSAGRGWGPALVMARKELRFYLRDPRQRLVWTGAAIFIGLAGASLLVGTSSLARFQTNEWLPAMAPILVLFVGLPIALNMFGWERNAASFLFVLPVSPRRMVVGKNLAAMVALSIETIVMAVALAALSGAWDVLPIVPALGVSAIACQMAVGNLVSVLAPLRLPREGTDVFAQATEQGCLAIGAQLVSFFVIAGLLVAPAAVAVLAVSFGEVIPDLIAGAFAVVWGATFYFASLWLTGKILQRRLPEVAQWVQVA